MLFNIHTHLSSFSIHDSRFCSLINSLACYLHYLATHSIHDGHFFFYIFPLMLFVICWIFTLPSGGVVCLMCILFLHSPTGSYLSYYLYLKMFSRNPVRSTSFECRYLFSHQDYEFFLSESRLNLKKIKVGFGFMKRPDPCLA